MGLEIENCMFCRIANKAVPATRLYEDDSVVSFLDIMPATKGHAIVIPKKHYSTLIDMPHSELPALIQAAQRIAAALMKATKASGFNILLSNGADAGQAIRHVHFHIIPRREGDDLPLGTWPTEAAEKKELEKYARLVRVYLNAAPGKKGK